MDNVRLRTPVQKSYFAGSPIYMTTCNWCGDQVQVESTGMPLNQTFRGYLHDFVVYCSDDCCAREYAYLESIHPDSVAVHGPLPDDALELLVNH